MAVNPGSMTLAEECHEQDCAQAQFLDDIRVSLQAQMR